MLMISVPSASPSSPWQLSAAADPAVLNDSDRQDGDNVL